MNDLDKQLDPVEEVPTICIVGDPGAGKTRLASLWPDAYFFDLEKGAGSAVPKERRRSYDIGPTMLETLKTDISKLLSLPYKDKRITTKDGLPIGGIVIDSLDALQQVHKYEKLGQTKYNEPRQMWGKLLDDLIPLVYLTKKLPIPTIWIAHAKVSEPVYNYDNLKKPGWRGIATQGSLEEQIIRWFDYTIHIYVEADFKRRAIVQPTIWSDYKILAAKDRHNTFKQLGLSNFIIEVGADGFPKTKCMQVIYDRHVY